MNIKQDNLQLIKLKGCRLNDNVNLLCLDKLVFSRRKFRVNLSRCSKKKKINIKQKYVINCLSNFMWLMVGMK